MKHLAHLSLMAAAMMPGLSSHTAPYRGHNEEPPEQVEEKRRLCAVAQARRRKVNEKAVALKASHPHLNRKQRRRMARR